MCYIWMQMSHGKGQILGEMGWCYVTYKENTMLPLPDCFEISCYCSLYHEANTTETYNQL